jgi:hypothetical protein
MAAPGYTVRLDRFEIRLQSIEAARRLVTQVVKEVREGAEAILAFGPYTTGRMARGVESRITYGAYSVEARVGVSGKRFPYAASVEGGAKRHHIPLLPKPKGTSLKFYWRKVGHIVYPRQVNHPGQTGKAYLRIPILVVAPKYNMRVFTYD